jgi:hypothetical protein
LMVTEFPNFLLFSQDSKLTFLCINLQNHEFVHFLGFYHNTNSPWTQFQTHATWFQIWELEWEHEIKEIKNGWSLNLTLGRRLGTKEHDSPLACDSWSKMINERCWWWVWVRKKLKAFGSLFLLLGVWEKIKRTRCVVVDWRKMNKRNEWVWREGEKKVWKEVADFSVTCVCRKWKWVLLGHSIRINIYRKCENVWGVREVIEGGSREGKVRKRIWFYHLISN